MKISLYLKDKLSNILLYAFTIFLIIITLRIFKVDYSVIIFISLVLIFVGVIEVFISYLKKRNFYNSILNNLKKLDKKYLVLETIKEPFTYEEKIMTNILYDINKSMIENINMNEKSIEEFKEFIELWIHEVKIPISSMVLKCHNNKEKYSKDFMSIIRKLDNSVDEVLYYVRSENTEKDFVITNVSLKEVIRNISLKNKDDLLENNIDFKVDDISAYVNTDKKWLEFILNQIINNCIKYKKSTNSLIKIEYKEEINKKILSIYDNGIGIPKSDINKVFNKSFTGTNGRDKVKSTGMGLYIVKNLCNKLGHDIFIESKEKEYTKVSIIFGDNDYYKM